jgi:hypothetical protein
MGCTLKLLFVGNQLVAEGWFIKFEIDGASKYVEVSKAWFSAIAVLVGCCWVSILVSDILSWARIYNVDGIGMCTMEEGADKLGSIQENVCSIVDFAPFGFTNAIHLLMFWGGFFKIDSKVIACCYEFSDVKADPASVPMKRTDFVWPSSSVCVSQDLRAVMIDAVLSVWSPIQPVNFPQVVTIKR